MTIQRRLQKILYAYIFQRNFSSFPSSVAGLFLKINVRQKYLATSFVNDSLPKFKSQKDFNFYWNCIIRADEDAMSKTRPWQRLELVPVYDRKN